MEIEKKVSLMNAPFSCEGCKVMMFRGNPRTAVYEGEKYTKPNASTGWTNFKITFLCSKCEPISDEQLHQLSELAKQ